MNWNKLTKIQNYNRLVNASDHLCNKKETIDKIYLFQEKHKKQVLERRYS